MKRSVANTDIMFNSSWMLMDIRELKLYLLSRFYIFSNEFIHCHLFDAYHREAPSLHHIFVGHRPSPPFLTVEVTSVSDERG